VLAFFGQHPDAWARLIEVLCDRLSLDDQQMAEFALSPVPVRLAKALLRLAVSDGDDGRGPLRVHLAQRELGNVIGATRESVNKYLRAWQRKGYVRIGECLIVITNQTAVENLTESEL
jgi:CRP-like cAMP-binding protein